MKNKNKILVSWIDYRHDFKEANGTFPNVNGINYEAHEFWYEQQGYQFHLLLSWDSGKANHYTATDNLYNLLQLDFPNHPLKLKRIAFSNPLNLPIIEERTNNVLADLQSYQVDILINSGYQMMQMAWLLSHQSLQFDTHLIQVCKREYTASKRPEPEEIILTESRGARVLLLENKPLDYDESLSNIMVPTLHKVYKRARVAAVSLEPVLIVGQSGTGKDELAKFIHLQRHEDFSNYYAVNCAAFSDDLLRSELFGHKKHSFTGADSDKKGFFEMADGGTLFLDEIGDTSAYIQQALLRVTQDGTFYRVGETEERQVSLKLITATNKNIQPKGDDNQHFREDLYYRLCVLQLRLPSWNDYPLNEKQTILDKLLLKVAQESQAPLLPVAGTAKKALLSLPMPGNLRQLHNFIKRLYVFCSDIPKVTLEALQEELDDMVLPQSTEDIPAASASLAEIEAWHIQRAWQLCRGNIIQTAESLGMARNTLKSKMAKYGMKEA